MKSKSLTTWIVIGLIVGVIVGFSLNEMASAEFNKSMQKISQLLLIFSYD